MVFHVRVPRARLLLAALVTALALLVGVVWLSRSWEEPPPPASESHLVRELQKACRLLLHQPLKADPLTRENLAWACGRVGVLLPWPREYGCGRAVTYQAADDLEQNLLRYAVLFSLARLLRADAQVEPHVLMTLRPMFPSLTLPPLPPPLPPPDAERWQPVAFRSALELVRCQPGEQPGDLEPRRYLISGPPDGTVIRLFHQYERELRQEMRLSSALQRRAQSVLQAALGRRVSATYVGLLLPAPSARRRPVSDSYLRQSLELYRRRLSDALFVVVASNATSLPPPLFGVDVVPVTADVERDPALSLAVRAACNHSILTGDDGFWGAYLAGGNMTVPPPEASDGQGLGWPLLHSQLVFDRRWTIVN